MGRWSGVEEGLGDVDVKRDIFDGLLNVGVLLRASFSVFPSRGGRGEGLIPIDSYELFDRRIDGDFIEFLEHGDESLVPGIKDGISCDEDGAIVGPDGIVNVNRIWGDHGCFTGIELIDFESRTYDKTVLLVELHFGLIQCKVVYPPFRVVEGEVGIVVLRGGVVFGKKGGRGGIPINGIEAGGICRLISKL